MRLIYTIVQTSTMLLVLVGIILTTGCGVTQRGYFSAPYTIDPPSKSAIAKHGNGKEKMATIELPDLTAQFELRNYLQSDSVNEHILPLPASRSEQWSVKPDTSGFCMWLSLYPHIDGMVLEPRKVTIIVDGERRNYKNVSRRVPYKRADNQYWSVRLMYTLQEEQQEMIALNLMEWKYLELCFFGSRPIPQQQIELHISDALHHPVPPVSIF